MPLPTSYSWVLTPGGTSASTGANVSGAAGTRASGNGKTGIAVPFGTDGRGRLAFVSGEAQLNKLIMLNLSDLESANPFQGDIGLSQEMIFAIANEALRADIRRRVNLLFRRLQLADRARLVKPVTFEQDETTQELTADIQYMNLEEDKPGSLSVTFSMIGQADTSASLATPLR